MSYHYRIAVGHYARVLAAESRRGCYAPVAVLQHLWCYVPDPYALAPFVRQGDELLGLVASRRALTEALVKLIEVGAVVRAEFGFVLQKPTVEELDAIAHSQLECVPAMLAGPEAAALARRTPAEREATAIARKERMQEKRQRVERRRAALSRLNKQASDVRDALAWLAHVPKTSLRYTGRGSAAVQSAIDWLASTGASWDHFLRVVKAAKGDASEDKPTDLIWLFDPRHDEYRTRLMERVQRGGGKNA